MSDPSTTHLMIRYRDDGESEWSNAEFVPLGNIEGFTSQHVQLKRLGISRSRQYEITATANVPIVLSQAEIDITVLR